MVDTSAGLTGRGVAKVLEMGRVFYVHFSFLDGHETGAKEPLFVDRARRMKNSTTFFSLICAIFENSNIVGYEAPVSDIANRVFDTLYRGSRDDIDDCLDAMRTSGLVEADAQKIVKNKRVSCIFLESYVQRVRGYINEMTEVVIGQQCSSGLWLQNARAIFDFMRFKYIPEWYLVMRRILRASRLTDSRKAQLYHDLFNSTGNWFAINFYIASYAPDANPKPSEREFSNLLMEKLRINREDAGTIIDNLTTVGFCGNVAGRLQIEPAVHECVIEYSNEIDREFERLQSMLASLL
jgi:hypothetical protein